MRLPWDWNARRPIDHLHSMAATLADPGEDRTPLQVVEDARWLQDQVDRAMRQLVDDAREAGASWADVGKALGVSRQAAHERFGKSGAHQSASTS